MKKYRARFDDSKTGAYWLTGDDNIHCDPRKAFVGTAGNIARLIARIILRNRSTVDSGVWTLERKRKMWVDVL